MTAIHSKPIETHVFHFAESIQWEDEDKEFILNGRLCDVVSVFHNGHETTVQYVYDEKEDGIVTTFYAEKNDHAKHPNELKIFKIIDDCICQQIEDDLLFYPPNSSPQKALIFKMALIFQSNKVLSPPPEFVFV